MIWQIRILLLFCVGWSITLSAQRATFPEAERLDSLLKAKQIRQAEQWIQQKQNDFEAQGQVDSLYAFPLYFGKIANAKTGKAQAQKTGEEFLAFLQSKTNNARTLYKAYLAQNRLLVDVGDDAAAVQASVKAWEYAQTLADLSGNEQGEINYTIGGDYYALYDLHNAVNYFKQSVAGYEAEANAAKDRLADAYNGVAVSMWTLNKLDSATVYFHKAIAATKESELEGFDRIYYIDAFKFNLALVVEAQGGLEEAIQIKREIIPNLQRIIDESEDEFLVNKSKRLLASAVSNLAAFYHDSGYLTKAYEMVKYAYKKKKEVFEKDSPRLAIALSQVASSELELLEFDNCIQTIDLALNNLRSSTNDYPSVEAELLQIQAKAYEKKGETAMALERYSEGEALFKKAYPEDYSREYLILLREFSQFLAKNGETERAFQLAQNSYEYILENGGSDNFPLLKEFLNLSEVYGTTDHYAISLHWAQQADAHLNEKLATATSQIDSIQIEFNRPAITALEVKALYQITKRPTADFHRLQLSKIEEAVAVLERRKTTSLSADDNRSVLAQYDALNQLSKKIHHALYEQTGDTNYLDSLIGLQESGIYNRIRTQFSSQKAVASGTLPQQWQEREAALKNALGTSLKAGEAGSLNQFFELDKQWQVFLDSLQQNYPKYYRLKYATIEQPLENLQAAIPRQTTLIRYFHIGEELFALVIAESVKELISLPVQNLTTEIQTLNENLGDIALFSTQNKKLYKMLWEPLVSYVNTEKLIIIPDGVLFNLSFELLSDQELTQFTALAENGLISRHQISYHFSPVLLGSSPTSINFSNNYVAFAPQFTEEMKSDYALAISDSIHLDRTYLRLLPQPFSAELASAYSRSFKGNSFLNEKSTKQLFLSEAKEHKIIHIATHAESNNISPELSRLVFAKNASDSLSLDDNYLYTYEIYNQNLASNLAILTACETGKPTHQPGEGMISLAHAFNYAGSESMLTSLWKIDEQTSTEIVGYFYDFLKEGMAKDEALRQAKLKYLSNAEGRTQSPEYWAGLVLMGNADPIVFEPGTGYWPWILGGLLLVLLLFFGYRKLTNRS